MVIAKKREEEKKKKFVKILFSELEFNEITKYAQNAFQSKSEFIRIAIREKIDRINREQYEILKLRSQAYKDFKKEFSQYIREGVMDELKNVIPLKKPDPDEMRKREESKKQRMIELEEIRRSLENEWVFILPFY